MRTILTIIMAVVTFISAGAYTFNYTFHNTPVSEAIVKISKEHPDINISFIIRNSTTTVHRQEYVPTTFTRHCAR